MEIRDARSEDSAAICELVRRSIVELCVDDHRNDASILALWLDGKTPEGVLAWVNRSDNSLLVVVEGEAILAAGAVTDEGEINLNYVSPDARFRGVSRALLAALEARALQRGATACTLTSTETARRFYRAAGYVEAATSVACFGLSCRPMAKSLAGPSSAA